MSWMSTQINLQHVFKMYTISGHTRLSRSCHWSVLCLPNIQQAL